jgi:PAS domain S-box-containing protein
MALEGAKEGLWSIDFIEGKMYFSGNTANILGYSSDDELGSTPEEWDKYTHPDDWPKVEQALIDHFEGKTEFYEAEYRAQTSTGDWKWILGHGRVTKRDSQGKPIQAIGTHVDITKLKETEIELRNSEERFRLLVENAPFGLLIMDEDRNIEYFNPKFESLFGYSQEDIPDIHSWFQKAYPDKEYRQQIINLWKEMEDESTPVGEFTPHTFSVRCKDGDTKVINFRHVILQEKKHLVTYEDITAQAEAEEALKKREQELEAQSKDLAEVNTALRVLLQRREEDQQQIEERVLLNVKDLVIPYVNKLETSRLNEQQKSYLNILKSNLNEIVSPFARRLAATNINLTPKEIRVANLIKEDMSTKEISEMLYISESSVEFHRHNIRRKLGLIKRKVNLKTYLQSLQ